MPKLYSLFLCGDSAFDADTGRFSAFNMIERLRAPEGDLAKPIHIQFHCHVEWSPEEQDKNFVMRLLRVRDDGHTLPGPNIPLEPAAHKTSHHYTRMFVVPDEYGDYKLQVEWREAGAGDDAWQRDPLAWPLSVEEAKEDESD